MRDEIVDRIKSDIMKLHESGASLEEIKGIIDLGINEIHESIGSLSKSIRGAGFKTRTENALIADGFKNIYQLSLCSSVQLLKITNISKKYLEDVKVVLRENGLSLKRRW